MPAKTTNFNLIKPGQEEFYNVNDQNANMDTIDGVLKTLQDAINSGATEEEIAQIRQELATHLADKANPHGVNKSQVGLGNVENYAIATKVDAQAGTSNDKYMTPLRVAEAMATLTPGQLVKVAEVNLNTNPAASAEFNSLNIYKYLELRLFDFVTSQTTSLSLIINDIQGANAYIGTNINGATVGSSSVNSAFTHGSFSAGTTVVHNSKIFCDGNSQVNLDGGSQYGTSAVMSTKQIYWSSPRSVTKTVNSLKLEAPTGILGGVLQLWGVLK